jgi:hypothetical protein
LLFVAGYYVYQPDHGSMRARVSAREQLRITRPEFFYDNLTRQDEMIDKAHHKNSNIVNDPYAALNHAIALYNEKPTCLRYQDMMTLSHFIRHHAVVDEKVNDLMMRVSKLS